LNAIEKGSQPGDVSLSRVLFLQHGRLAEQGSHAELMARNGLYAAMYRAWEESAEVERREPPGTLEQVFGKMV
jgi:hypothetical protein